MSQPCRWYASVINALSWSARGLVTITSSGVKVPLIRGALTPDDVIVTRPRADQDNALITDAYQLHGWDSHAV